MHQSPDDIFAAHFWAWPDPALKRDAHGRVLFVNAAFLQLFGGSVDDWRGQTVQGWHAPQGAAGPARFEIRTPATAHAPEQVYDWIEVCGADGSAFALARNVTVFASQTPPDTPAPMDPPADPPALNAAPVQDAPAPFADAPVHEPVASRVETVAQSPAAQPSEDAVPGIDAVAQSPIADPVPAIADTPAADLITRESAPAAPAIDTPAAMSAPEPASAPEAEPLASYTPAAPTPKAPAAAPPLPAEPAPAEPARPEAGPSQAEPERSYERRALPIENDEAVLGSNWRDAVIAKAVGAVDAAEPDAAPDAPAKADAAATQAGGTIRILLAEDNAINALLTRTLLEAEGHTVETVEDGALAVEAMKTSSFDMIFMDMRMPNMDGLESTRKIRALPGVSRDLPIVALTANAFDDDRNACFDSGMNDFMTKPVSAEELSEMVARWTGAQDTALAS